MGFKPRQRRVTVYWLDSASHSGWTDDEVTRDAARCTTTGFLLRRSATHLEIAQSVSEHGMVGEVICIPSSCVQRFEVIK